MVDLKRHITNWDPHSRVLELIRPRLIDTIHTRYGHILASISDILDIEESAIGLEISITHDGRVEREHVFGEARIGEHQVLVDVCVRSHHAAARCYVVDRLSRVVVARLRLCVN